MYWGRRKRREKGNVNQPLNQGTGEVSAGEWVPVFPVFNQPLVLWKKIFCLFKNDLFYQVLICSLEFPVSLVFPDSTVIHTLYVYCEYAFELILRLWRWRSIIHLCFHFEQKISQSYFCNQLMDDRRNEKHIFHIKTV